MATTAHVGIGVLVAGLAAATCALPALAQAPSTTLPKLTLPGLAGSPAATPVPIVGGAASAAEQAAQPAAQAQWTKLCSADPQSPAKSICAVRVEIPDSTGQQLLVSATVQTVQDDPNMLFIVTVPPGMLLQPGIQVAIDSNRPMPLAYTICVPNACFAQMNFTADNLKAMRAGEQLTVAAIDQTEQQVSLPISLDGFAKVYDGPGSDVNSASGQTALDALSTSLQQHADQARQNLLVNQQLQR